jgi:hypothetical protein
MEYVVIRKDLSSVLSGQENWLKWDSFEAACRNALAYGGLPVPLFEAENIIKSKAIGKIKGTVSIQTGVSVQELESKSRQQHIVRARNIAMKKCREEGMTLSIIGKAFNRNHSTVMHSITPVSR